MLLLAAPGPILINDPEGIKGWTVSDPVVRKEDAVMKSNLWVISLMGLIITVSNKVTVCGVNV